MDIKTKDALSKLHKTVLDTRLNKMQWWPMAQANIEPAAWQETVSSAKMGLDYLLNNPGVEALAITAFPWMTNRMESEIMYGPNKGTMQTYPSWLEKIKETKATTRPKDLIHLSIICEIAENMDSGAFDDMC